MNPKDPTDRFYFVPAYETPVCNGCKHRDLLKCDAFPEGIPKHVIEEKIQRKGDAAYLERSCNGRDEIGFEPKE